MNGVPVGEWRIDAQGRHTFSYGESWIGRPDARPLSLSMPLQPPDAPYKGGLVESFFDNLLPDSADIRRRVQRRVGAPSTSAFDLLAEIGRDCVGAVQLLPAGSDAGNVETIEGLPLDEAGVAAAIRSAVSAPPLGQRDEESLRISLAGAQEKTALLWHAGMWQQPTGATPTTHIFKLPLGRVGNMQADLSTSVENEWLCTQVVREVGLPVAECEIMDVEDQHVLVVERFDRK
ncbi:MAG: HipA N-terminal domain-containing protein, partial [Woeseiaceae bacterium]